jgi:S-adenosylmethionine hydrolase
VGGGPIITLLTDFGTADSYVAETKGALLCAAPHATLVDLSHDVPPGDVAGAQFLLSRSWFRFPTGTVHLAVVDPGVGGPRRALAVASSKHFFVGPDNGLFTPVLDGARVVALEVRAVAAPTFHGRDVFAPAAGALAAGAALASLGEAIANPTRLAPPTPAVRDGVLVGTVLHVDRFGTLVTNLPATAVAPDTTIRILDRVVGPLRRTFADVPSGALLALVGSGGTVEIAARDASAARLLGVGRGAAVGLVTPGSSPDVFAGRSGAT